MRAVGVGCGLLVLIGLLSITWMQADRTQRMVDEMREGGAPGGEFPGGESSAPAEPAVPASPALVEIDRLLAKNVDEALAACRRLAESATDPAEREAADKKLAVCLFRVFDKRRDARKFAEAEAIVRELGERHAEAPETRWARDQWAGTRSDRLREALKKGDVERVEALVAELEPDGSGSGASHLLEEVARFRLEEWRKARRAGDTEKAMAHLIAAAAAMADEEGWAPLIQALEKDWPADELVSTAEQLLKDGHAAAALCFFTVPVATNLRHTLKLGAEDEEKLRDRADECRLALAVAARAAGRLTSNRGHDRCASNYYAHVRNSRRPERVLEALRGLMEVHRDEALRRAAANDFHEGRESLQRALLHARELWLAEAELSPTEPRLPDEARALLDEKAPGDDPVRRRQALRSLVQEGKIDPPSVELAELRRVWVDFSVSRGLHAIRKQIQSGYVGAPEQELADLRSALRADPAGENAKRIVAGVREAIPAAREKRIFDLLVELSGFYLEEVGPPDPGDEFHATLKSSLLAAAESDRKSSPIRRAFLLTLLADACPGDPEAQAARDEVVPLALAEAGKNEPGEAPLAVGPSGAAGFSAHRIENDTHTYLLLFYDGPERFFVRLAPRRRGTLVLKDGKYLTAVMTSQEGVLSYRAEFTGAGSLFASAYTIQEGGGANAGPFAPAARASAGDFRLLRVPAGEGGFRVDGQLGTVGRD